MIDRINKSRRRFLVGSTSALGAIGAVGVATPFVCSWQPNEAAKAAGAPVEVDVSKLEEGQQVTVEWQGKPVWVLHRSPKAVANLSLLNSQLVDPKSLVDQQPAYADNIYRSIKPEYLVLIGVCTHLGCTPSYEPSANKSASIEKKQEVLSQDNPAKDVSLLGGYFCPCHGSRFDLAGRVYKNCPAPTNLVVPPYYFKNDKVIVLGAHQQQGDA